MFYAQVLRDERYVFADLRGGLIRIDPLFALYSVRNSSTLF